jgi:hypothetical protein
MKLARCVLVALLGCSAPACAALESWDQASGVKLDGGGDAFVGDSAAPPDEGGDAGPAITFVQANAAALDNMSRRSLDVTYNNAQVAGDMNVIIIGWYDTSVTLTSVTDSSGNPYQPAGPPAAVNGQDPIVQMIYFAPHIAGAVAGANVVTATWDSPACAPDVRILEYHGVSALDVTAGASGADAPAKVDAAVPTKFAPELIVAGGTSTNGFTGVDPAFTLAIISDGSDIAEHRIVDKIDTYSATASLSGKSWVMQLATFH